MLFYPHKIQKTVDPNDCLKLKQITEEFKILFSEMNDDLSLETLTSKCKQIPIRKGFFKYNFHEELRKYVPDLKCYAVTVGKGVTQFSAYICSIATEKENFQISLLILLFLQYISDKSNDSDCLASKNVFEITRYAN